MKLQYLKRITDRKAEPLTKEAFEAILANPWTEENVARARMHLANGDKEQYSKAKSLLPAIMWCGYSEEGERKADMLSPTQLYMIDIDHVRAPQPPEGEEVENVSQHIRKVFEETIAPRCEELGIVLAHVTPSGRGLRIVAMARQDFPTLKEHMDWLVDKLNLRQHGYYDEACKDFSRLSFMVGKEDILFIDWSVFDIEPAKSPLTPQGGTWNNAEDASKGTAGNQETPPSGDGGLYAKIRSTAKYRDHLLTEIIEKYLSVFGTPVEGERHNFYNKLVKHFRNLCNNDPAILHAVLPRFGLPFAETEKQCKGLTRENHTSRHEKQFYWFLVDNGFYPKAEEMTDKDMKELLETEPKEVDIPVPPLPPVFREFVSQRGNDFAWPTIYGLMPIMGTQASYLRSEYADHEPLSTTFYSLIYAGAGMGKSFCKPFEQKLFEITRMRDAIATMREQIYLKSKKADDSNAANPHVLVRKMALINSQAEFLEKMYDNKGWHMFTFAEEVDSFIKGTKAAGGDKTDMLRIAWDNGEYSQSFKSANSFKGTVNMYYNILMTGTPDQIKKAFPNIENGMITRVMFCPLLNQEFAKFQVPKKLNKRQLEVIDKFIQRCDDNTYREPLDFTVEEAREVDEKDFDKQVPWKYTYRNFTHIDLSWLYPHIMKWLEEKRIEALLSQDHAKDTFRRRVGRMGASLALLCYACWDRVGKKEEEIIKNFVLAFMEKDLKERMRLYGDKYNEIMKEGDRIRAKSANSAPSLYDELPDRFEKSDLVAKALKLGICSPVKVILCRWRKEGVIKNAKEKDVYIKSPSQTSPKGRGR